MAVIRILDYDWAWYGLHGSIRPRYGNWDLAINIYAVNPCKDGYSHHACWSQSESIDLSQIESVRRQRMAARCARKPSSPWMGPCPSRL